MSEWLFVFVVTFDNGSDYSILAVCATEEAAKKRIPSFPKYEGHQWPVKELVWIRRDDSDEVMWEAYEADDEWRHWYVERWPVLGIDVVPGEQ